MLRPGSLLRFGLLDPRTPAKQWGIYLGEGREESVLFTSDGCRRLVRLADLEFLIAKGSAVVEVY